MSLLLLSPSCSAYLGFLKRSGHASTRLRLSVGLMRLLIQLRTSRRTPMLMLRRLSVHLKPRVNPLQTHIWAKEHLQGCSGDCSNPTQRLSKTFFSTSGLHGGSSSILLFSLLPLWSAGVA